jgi:hypothetical protein
VKKISQKTMTKKDSMKKTNPSFNSFSPFSLSNPFFAQTITIAIVIAVHCNDRQQRMQPALSPPLPPSLVNYHRHRDDLNYYQHTPCFRLQRTLVTAATTTLPPHFQTCCCYG